MVLCGDKAQCSGRTASARPAEKILSCRVGRPAGGTRSAAGTDMAEYDVGNGYYKSVLLRCGNRSAESDGTA